MLKFEELIKRLNFIDCLLNFAQDTSNKTVKEYNYALPRFETKPVSDFILYKKANNYIF